MGLSTSNISSRVNIEVRRGDSFHRNFTFSDPATGLPENLTGCIFAMKVVDGSGNIILAITPTSISNKVMAVQTKSQMLIPFGNYQYDLKETLTDGTQVTRLHGFFIVDRNSTL